MIKLICFPHYTCGGLLCDILNATTSEILPNGGISNHNHDFGKIGDSDSVFYDYNAEDFLKKIETLGDKRSWISTRCHPKNLPLNKFEKVINITTTTYRSKIYRWARSYYHYYFKSPDWQLTGQDLTDKQRETAKNYLIPAVPVTGENVINLEFCDVVEFTSEFLSVIYPCNIENHAKRWKENNSFLYEPNFWNSIPAKSYYEAEFEVNLSRNYIYK